MVREKDPDPAGLEPEEDPLDFDDSEGIDAREGLVEEQKLGFEGQGPGDFQPAPFSSRERIGPLAGQGGQAEFVQEGLGGRAPFAPRIRQKLDGQTEVVPDRRLEEDRIFLGKIGQSGPGPLVGGPWSDVLIVEQDPPAVRLEKADDHLEACRLARPVPAQQTDDLAGSHADVHVLDDEASAETLDEMFGEKEGHLRVGTSNATIAFPPADCQERRHP